MDYDILGSVYCSKSQSQCKTISNKANTERCIFCCWSLDFSVADVYILAQNSLSLNINGFKTFWL